MNCLSRRAEIDVPLTPASPVPTFPKPPFPAVPTALLLHAALVAGATAGSVGTVGVDPSAPTVGNTLGSGTAGVELTPRLVIS